jgi:type VI secretion system VasD/TssJ family lipoprotein
MSGYCLRKTRAARLCWGGFAAGLGLVVALGSALSATGCGAAPPKTCDKQEQVTLHFEPHPQLNQDREGYPRSVVVRLYQLEGAEAFSAATFEDLWQVGAKPHPSVLTGPDELTLIPGRREERKIKRNPKATHFAMTANFREYHPDSGWKATLELAQVQDACADNPPKNEVTAELANYTLQLR